MAIQSIGARYVPKFYENPDTTNNWKSGVDYEPLTIVTWNGNNFTSKKYVPSTVGEPNLNPSYWVSTGIYNAQIETYREETLEALETANNAQSGVNTLNTKVNNLTTRVNTAEDDIDHLQEEIDDIHFDVDTAPLEKTAPNRKYIFLFDSYGAAENHGDIRTALISKMNLNSQNSWLKGVSGTGFGRIDDRGATHNTYLDSLQQYPSNYGIDKKDITDIIIQTAGNDTNRTAQSTQQGITDFAEYCRTNFPNARILVCYTLWSRNSQNLSDRRTTMFNLKTYLSNTPNMYFMEGVENCAKYLGDATNETHPGATVDSYFAESIKNAIITGTADNPYIHASRCYFVQDSGDVHFATDAGCQNFVSDGMVVLNFTGEVRGLLNSAITISGSSNRYEFSLDLGEMSFERFFNATQSAMFFYLRNLEFYVGGHWVNALTGSLRFVNVNGNMHVYLYGVLDSPTEGVNITHFRFKNETMMIPANWC